MGHSRFLLINWSSQTPAIILEPGAWGRFLIKPSLWTASIGVSNTGEFGERIAFLAAFHQESPSIQKLKACPASFDVGVDSGQAGIFDYNHFHDETVIGTQELADFGSLWFTHCCYQTMESEHQAGLIPYGVVS